MIAYWADELIMGILAGYIVLAIWYLARPMEDDNEQQQH